MAKNINTVREDIERIRSALKYLGGCILTRSAKGADCTDLMEQHDKRTAELAEAKAALKDLIKTPS